MEAMDKMAGDLEDAARRHNSRILYWHTNKLRGSRQSGFIPVEKRNSATISNIGRIKEKFPGYFEDVLNSDKATRKDIEDNEKV